MRFIRQIKSPWRPRIDSWPIDRLISETDSLEGLATARLQTGGGGGATCSGSHIPLHVSINQDTRPTLALILQAHPATPAHASSNK